MILASGKNLDFFPSRIAAAVGVGGAIKAFLS